MQSFLELEVSRTCNLACNYCYMKPFLKPLNAPDRFLTIDEALKFIDEYSKLPQVQQTGNISIELFGGEPFLNIAACTYLLRNVHKYNGMPVGYSCVTNCTIFHKEYAEAINNGILNCEISIDDPVNHTKYRRTVKGKNSYTLCIRTLAQYSKYLSKQKQHSMRLRSCALSLSDIPRILIHWNHLYKSFPACGSLFINKVQQELSKETPYYSFWMIAIVRAFRHLKPAQNMPVCPYDCYFCTRPCMSSLYGISADRITVRRYNVGVSSDLVDVPFASTGDYTNKLLGVNRRAPDKDLMDFYIENCHLIVSSPEHRHKVLSILEDIIRGGAKQIISNFEKFHLLDFVPACEKRTELKKAIADVIDFYANKLRDYYNLPVK